MLLDFLFPRHCTICGTSLNPGEEEICIMCNAKLPRLDWLDNPYDNPLARMYFGRIEFKKAAAFLKFVPHSHSAELVYGKYRKDSRLCRFLGRLIALEAEGTDFFKDIDMIVPMPITATREYSRGFNQCVLIGMGLSEVTGIPMNATAVLRTDFHVSQTRLEHSERRDNVENAFAVVNPAVLEGKHILIIDDVITTGSTTISLAKEIKSAVPNTKISFLSFCKTVSYN